MSRIVLSKYDTGQERVVIGWDHPAGGAFWQEFNQEPADGNYPDDWEEMIRYGGYMPGISLDDFPDAVPEDIRPMITQEVMNLLAAHSRDPDSGYRTAPVDLSDK
jgi:hypothetical protein